MIASAGVSVAPSDDAFRHLVETHQRAVRLHCYRMLGSVHDAEDVTQETLLRAWRSLDRFEGRASVRAWLYRIATNACLDERARRGRRLLPSQLGVASTEFAPGQGTIDDTPWLEPFPDTLLDVADTAPGPEARYETKKRSSWPSSPHCRSLPRASARSCCCVMCSAGQPKTSRHCWT